VTFRVNLNLEASLNLTFSVGNLSVLQGSEVSGDGHVTVLLEGLSNVDIVTSVISNFSIGQLASSVVT